MASPKPADAALAHLVRKAQGGDRQAEATLLTSLEPIIRAFFFRRIGAHAELDDLVQNTLLRVFRGINEIKDGNRIKAFTMKAALFELQDLYRGRYGSREATVSADVPEPAVRPLRTGLSIDIERALSSLTPKARRIIELKSLGYRYEEIAVMMESTEAAIKMQVKRALSKLKTLLAILIPLVGIPAGMLLLEGVASVLLFGESIRLLS